MIGVAERTWGMITVVIHVIFIHAGDEIYYWFVPVWLWGICLIAKLSSKQIHLFPLNPQHNTHRTSLNLKQDFLEYTPYYDHSEVKVNTFKNKAPFTGKVVSTKRIVGPKATGETCHIIIDHNGDFPYIEGQSWGVLPPGTREKDGKPHAVRLYSIASSRYGDDMTGKTGSLCVRRATYWCPELKADDPTKKGVCSNFLCDSTPGTSIDMTGPAGKVMLMPEQNPNTDYIMVATGTGIAPFRGFVRRLFFEPPPPLTCTRVRLGSS